VQTDPYAEVLAEIAANQLAIKQQQEAAQQAAAARQLQIQQQIQIQQQRSNVANFAGTLRAQTDLEGQRVDVETPDPLELEYLYDFSSIFATPEQEELFVRPYAKGGQVGDLTDKILLIIGENG
jgi:hypothetical protein